jgi:hypothetical protein
VADEVRGRKTYCKQVGDASPPELEVVDENTGCLHCVRIDEVQGRTVAPLGFSGGSLECHVLAPN